MNGQLDDYGRALVTISVRASDEAPLFAIQAWIDTGFNGDLVLPQRQITKMCLPAAGTVMATLADGSEITLQLYSCSIDWFGENRDLEVVAKDGEYPLLGVGLLVGHDLHISYRSGSVSIE